MESQTAEVRVGRNDEKWKIMRLVKERLVENPTVRVVTSHLGAPEVIKAVHTLSDLGYGSVSNISTETKLGENKLVGILLDFNRSTNFKQLFDAYEEETKKKKEARENTENKQ